MEGFLILIGGLGALYLLWRASGSRAGGAAPAPPPDRGVQAVAPPVPAPKPASKSAPKPVPEPAAEPASRADPEPASAPPERPAHLTFHEAPPDRVDDLRRIKGIGPKMEALLNENGIYQYEQIAAFTEADLAWLDGATGSFPGRAARDDWVAQAAGLAAERDGN